MLLAVKSGRSIKHQHRFAAALSADISVSRRADTWTSTRENT